MSCLHALAQTSSQQDSGALGGAAILGLLIFVLYFLPAAAAWNKSHFSSVFVLNLFLGWTLVGWVVALAWGLKKEVESTKVVVQSPAVSTALLCRNCGKYSSPTAKFCENCGQALAKAAIA
jgi:hypothetical protein